MPALRFLDLELQTVTPLMTGGAFYQAELRPPSFRGVMRYWLRALLGGVLLWLRQPGNLHLIYP